MYINPRRRKSYHYRNDLLANYGPADLAALARIFEKAANTYSKEGDSCTAQALLMGSEMIRDRAALNRTGRRI